MSRWRLAGLGLIAYLLVLIATAPASLVDAQLARATDGGLRLALASGTLWSGQGQLEILDASRRSGLAKEIAWRMRPAHLLRGKLRFDITLDRAPRSFPLTLTPSRLEVVDADINLPAATLGLGVPKLAALGLTGNMLLHLARLSVGSASIQGNATLQWQGAGSTFAPIAPLGDYELRIEGKGKQALATLRTLQGPLQLEGSGAWQQGSKPTFQGYARVPPQHLQRMAPLMRMFAIERGDGRFELLLR